MVLRIFSSQVLPAILIGAERTSILSLLRSSTSYSQEALSRHHMLRLSLIGRIGECFFHLSLEKEVEIRKPENIIKPVNVNENSVATIYEAFAIILETDFAKTTLGYSYRKKGIQKRNGSNNKGAKETMKKLEEGEEEGL
jgi:hypothetical protein